VFENVVFTIENINNIPRSGHFFFQNILDVKLGDPRLLPGIVFIFAFLVLSRKIFFKEK
jgi:hypothetical protein